MFIHTFSLLATPGLQSDDVGLALQFHTGAVQALPKKMQKLQVVCASVLGMLGQHTG